MSGMSFGVASRSDSKKRCGSLRAHNMITNLGSIANIIGRDLYDHLMSTRIFMVIINKISYEP